MKSGEEEFHHFCWRCQSKQKWCVVRWSDGKKDRLFVSQQETLTERENTSTGEERKNTSTGEEREKHEHRGGKRIVFEKIFCYRFVKVFNISGHRAFYMLCKIRMTNHSKEACLRLPSNASQGSEPSFSKNSFLWQDSLPICVCSSHTHFPVCFIFYFQSWHKKWRKRWFLNDLLTERLLKNGGF